MNLIDRVHQYAEGVKTLTAWLGSGAATVDGHTAQTRANVCVVCPMNTNDFSLVEAVAIAIKKQVELKNHLGLRVIGEKSLHTCSGCGCALRLKVHVPLKSLGVEESELPNFDPSCWMRKEFNQLKKP